MKTILTLLMATGTFVTLHAQSREEARQVILGDERDNGAYDRRNNDVVWNGDDNGHYPTYPNGGYANNRQHQIERVNRDYDARIFSVRSNRYLSNREKKRTIRQLEKDRRERINEINREYDRGYGRNGNDERHDNGKW